MKALQYLSGLLILISAPSAFADPIRIPAGAIAGYDSEEPASTIQIFAPGWRFHAIQPNFSTQCTPSDPPCTEGQLVDFSSVWEGVDEQGADNPSPVLINRMQVSRAQAIMSIVLPPLSLPGGPAVVTAPFAMRGVINTFDQDGKLQAVLPVFGAGTSLIFPGGLRSDGHLDSIAISHEFEAATPEPSGMSLAITGILLIIFRQNEPTPAPGRAR
jgi:hypothetical protein